MKNYWNKYYFLFLDISFLLFIFFLFRNAEKNMDFAWKNSKYTVAYITSNWHQKNSNGMGTDFLYEVNGLTISKTCSCDLKKGTKYLVLYDSLKPSNYIMLAKHKLPENTKAPQNGWKLKDVPIKIDSADLKLYFEELDMK